MTDAFPSDDELVSSYLDGEATPSEIERVESSPQLMARLGEFRRSASLMAAPVTPLASPDIDSLIESALESSHTSGNVVDLAAATQRRWWQQPRVLAAAAAVALLALAVPALRSISESDSSADSAAAPTGLAQDGDAEISEAATTTAAAEAPLAPLGDDSLDSAGGSTSDSLQSEADAPTATTAAANATTADFDYRLPLTDPAFDPLPEELLPTTDLTSLGTQISSLLAEFSSAESLPAADSDGGRVVLDQISPACTQQMVDVLFPGSNVANADLGMVLADYATVLVDGNEFIVAVVRIEDEIPTVLAADTLTCSTVELLEIVP